MNAKEFAHVLEKAASFIRQQQDVIKAQKEYMEAQDDHIVDLAFRLVDAERANDVVMEANTRSRP
jgi:hypothetical protein